MNGYPKPFLKWAGGKTQLLQHLLPRFPYHTERYFEPFMGSAAVYFGLVRARKISTAFLSDSNPELVDAFIAVRDYPSEVMALLSTYEHSSEFYYRLRSQDPNDMPLVERAARMIYLNKTGYNGLYRVNRQGKFNVPFGRYKSPRFFDRDNFGSVSEALQSAEVSCRPFDWLLELAKAGDVVYFDPPYVPLSATSSFTGYHANGFDIAAQVRLANVYSQLTERGVLTILSNSYTDFVLDAYKNYDVHFVPATRMINSNGAKRGKLLEVIVTNVSLVGTNYEIDTAEQLRLLERSVEFRLSIESQFTSAT